MNAKILLQFAGLPIFVSAFCVKRTQFRFPKSKKRRIREKWQCQSRNFKDVPTMMRTPFGVVCHPSIAAIIREISAH